MSQGAEVNEWALVCYRNTKAFCRDFEQNLTL